MGQVGIEDSIRFVPVYLEPVGIWMELPEGFLAMEEDRRRRRYPRKGRPGMILENDSGVQITAQLLEEKAKAGRIYPAAEQLRLLTRELFPRYETSPVYLCEEGMLPIGWFRMEMPDMEAGHIKALSVVKEGMPMLTFTYPMKEAVKWECVIRQSFGTWRV